MFYSIADLLTGERASDMYTEFVKSAQETMSTLQNEKLKSYLQDDQLIHMFCGTVFWTILHSDFQRDLDINNREDLLIMQYLNDRQNMILLFSRKLVGHHPYMRQVTQDTIDALMKIVNEHVILQPPSDQSSQLLLPLINSVTETLNNAQF